MEVSSRTSLSLKNARVSLTFYFLQLILSFFSRSAFFKYLGSEVLGLNTTATNLVGVLNLAELGIGVCVSYFLYKPLFNDDRETIKKIISVQGWLYRRVALVVICVGAGLMCFFPLIFAKSSLPLWYAYSTFGVLIFGAMLGYFLNYRQILLNADQKNYLVNRAVQGTLILKVIFQILAVTYFQHPFIWWLSLELAFSIVTCIVLDKVIKSNYPWLETEIKKGKEYNRRFPEIIKKTRQVFVHQLAGTALVQISPLVIYAFSSLTTVAYYGNYIAVVGKLTSMMGAVFNSTGAAIGNLVASGDRERETGVFWELFDSRFCISAIFLICAYFLINPFISIWLDASYLLSDRFLIFFMLMQGILSTRSTVDSFISAHGMYQDVAAPLIEAGLNVGLSILFGSIWGIEGVIIGITISLLMVVELWKPFFLFKLGMNSPVIPYFMKLGRNLLIVLAVMAVCHYVCPVLPFYSSRESGFLKWSIFAFEFFIIVSAMCAGLFFLTSKGFRDFSQRMIGMRKR